jgi:hypothetical protein
VACQREYGMHDSALLMHTQPNTLNDCSAKLTPDSQLERLTLCDVLTFPADPSPLFGICRQHFHSVCWDVAV